MPTGSSAPSSRPAATADGSTRPADHLESIAARLREGERLDVEVDGETVPVYPVDSPTYQIQIEDERVDGEIEREVGFTLLYPRTDDEEPLTEDGL